MLIAQDSEFLFLDPIGAYDIDEKLVDSTCLKYYRKFWDRFVSETKNSSSNRKPNQTVKHSSNENIELDSTEYKNRKL